MKYQSLMSCDFLSQSIRFSTNGVNHAGKVGHEIRGRSTTESYQEPFCDSGSSTSYTALPATSPSSAT